MIKERLLEFLESEKITKSHFEKTIKAGNGYISNVKTIGSDKLEDILRCYPSLNIEWLIAGKGNMRKENALVLYPDKIKGATPYYEDLPMSAGQAGLGNGESSEKPSGYMAIPSVSAQHLFPVIGYSMLPRIKPGDIIGVNLIERWERVDPDKIYLIITGDERMIKRLRVDSDNEDVLWCVSDNYKEFKIKKEEIIKIFHVVYHGELL